MEHRGCVNLGKVIPGGGKAGCPNSVDEVWHAIGGERLDRAL
jgi:hypothetical protein